MILQLLTELNQDLPVDYVPQQKVQPGDKVLGVVGIHAQRLFSIIQRHANLVEVKSTQLTVRGVSLNEAMRIVEEVKNDLLRLTLLRQVLWTEIREEVGAPFERLSICEDWQVVASEVVDEDCGDPNCPAHGHKHTSESAAD